MAVYMATGGSTPHVMGVAQDAMPADCPMVMTKTVSSEKSAEQGDGTSERGCQSCQLCMSLATPDTPSVQGISAEPVCAPMPRTDRFTSADPARAAKPPIT